MACEEERTRLIGQIASLLREGSVPEEARRAGLTLIGWLARRLPGEPVSIVGVEEMLKRCAERGYSVSPSMNGARPSRSKETNGPKKTNGVSAPASKQSSGDKPGMASRASGRRAR